MSAHYRTTAYTQAIPPRPNVTDDYERWYTEAAPNNRMVLSLRSGINTEIGWALDRLCRLCDNEQFLLRSIPGLTDALFEWPEWYVNEGYRGDLQATASIFASKPQEERKRRHALESLFILRNAALNEPNAVELANHRRTQPLIISALLRLDSNTDEHTEFVLHVIELLQAVGSNVVLPHTPASQSSNPLLPLQRMAYHSSNRSIIMASLAALNVLFLNPLNVGRLTSNSLALKASLKYLPLFVDKPLIEVCLNYLQTHLSNPPMAKAFLLNPEMPSTLKLLVSLLVSEQVEEVVALDVSGVVHTAPALTQATRDHELTEEELAQLMEKPEPQRCYEWMKTLFVAKAEGELTQVDFWNLYKDVFLPFQDRVPLLVASDVIKNVNVVFPQAQAMVLPGPPQKFVVRGVDRRKEDVPSERFKCQWERSHCTASPFASPRELYEHTIQHLDSQDNSESPCEWATCSYASQSTSHLKVHILTHLPSSQPSAKDPSQSDTITLPSDFSQYPVASPTSRPPPPPRRTTITYKRPIANPPSSSLTALLCIRILFRQSFASSEAAPRVDADHFGFPGVVEDTDDQDDFMDTLGDGEQEGERRGRKAFVAVRKVMEGVQMRDETLMGWITEMVDVGITGAL